MGKLPILQAKIVDYSCVSMNLQDCCVRLPEAGKAKATLGESVIYICLFPC